MLREQNKGANFCGHGEIYVMEFLSTYEPSHDVSQEGESKDIPVVAMELARFL